MKPLWQISIVTTLEAEDAVAELLGTVFNCNSSAYFDAETQTSIVSVYFFEKRFLSREVREEVSAGLRQIKSCGLKIAAGKIKIKKVRREDWAESWKRHFKPIEIGASLLVKPSWSKKRPRKNQAFVILDPGLSFGTGQHATTSFCLHQIVAAAGRPPQILEKLKNAALCREAATAKSFLDIGTGSGILAIAAAKLGYKPVRAFDFDPEAIRVACANARVNKVGRKLKITCDDMTKLPLHTKQKYDLVCANLISNLLTAERRRIVAQLNRCGILVLAGILKSEFTQVQTAFEDLGLELVASKSEKEWRSGSFCFSAK
ncbi:MAG TPA: 50S ribosomal protein L11 methyltransferase [Verrucomicrobiae bacterium]|jgi:ribosomal protein L11 methyltransferase|nr:50S ribosomal protein L11 methyltransferase [Verrucomicrobiae bacterium]